MIARARIALTMLAVALPARAEPDTGEPHKVRFRADALELDSRNDRLELDGNVVVTVDRYRLTSDRLSLERGPRGVVVRGGGRVAFCPCPDPPVTLGFRSATVAPPTDLLLEQPTLRAFGVPFFWLPYLWLRSPRRIGLLPMDAAYRGRDGAFLGSGVHVPFGQASALDVGAGAYFRGGAQVDARLVTPRTASAVRWDHLRRSAVSVDLRGVTDASAGATVAWSVDALRGPRALSGPASLEDVSLRHDRARLALGTSDGKWTAGVEGAAAAVRGGPVDGGYGWSPGAAAAMGAALGRHGTVDAAAQVSTWRSPVGGAVTLASERFELRGATRGGPFRFSAEARSRGGVALGEFERGHFAAAGAAAEVSAPLVKDFGPADSPMQHWIVPFAGGLAGIADGSGATPYGRIVGDGGFYTATAGMRTLAGRLFGDRAAAQLSLRLALLGQGRESPEPYGSWLATAQVPFAGVRGEGVVAAGGGEFVTVTAVRVGPENGPRLLGRAVNRNGSIATAARLVQGGWDAPFAPWFDVPGWSAGGGAVVPWTRFLASAADVDVDVENRKLLGLRGTLGYRHPCRCLAVALWAGHRLGRAGVDAWLTVDIMP